MRRLRLDHRGASTVEYALMLFAVLLVGAGAMRLIGPAILGTVDRAGGHIAAGGEGAAAAGGGGGGAGQGAGAGATGGGAGGGTATGGGAAGSGGKAAGATGTDDTTVGGKSAGGAGPSASGAAVSANRPAEGGDVSSTGLAKYADGHGGFGKWIAAFMILLGLVAAFFAMKKSKGQSAS